LESIIVSMVLKMLPLTWAANPWFLIGVLVLWLVAETVMPFFRDPKYGWLAKYNGVAHLAVGIFGTVAKKLIPALDQMAKAGLQNPLDPENRR